MTFLMKKNRRNKYIPYILRIKSFPESGRLFLYRNNGILGYLLTGLFYGLINWFNDLFFVAFSCTL